ncbi:YciI family protein [Pendulispora rubella]|uniref:YciI family protein n=1 Tax=Pendulispora rubella TaxID=2741070 RepID=A0ABZ2L5X1_9BACT
MRYICLIYSDEASFEKMSPEEQGKLYAEYEAFRNELAAAGNVKLAGDQLKPAHTATSVRVRHGKVQTTDGPFAETKEQLGGYYILECKNLDEALKWAAKIPSAKDGTIEVRPIVDLP